MAGVPKLWAMAHCEGIATGLREQPASTRILPCVSSGWARARVLHLHEKQVCVHAAHKWNCVCACLPATCAKPSPPPAGPQSWKRQGILLYGEKMESLGHLPCCRVFSVLRFSPQGLIPSSAATVY